MNKQISLREARNKYTQTLKTLGQNPDDWLKVLLARDQVEIALADQRLSLSLPVIEQINELDKQLHEKLSQLPQEQLLRWRELVHPPESAWWWWDDKKSAERSQQNDRPFEILAGTCLVLSAPIAIDIIKRLSTGIPDTVSIFGSLLTLLLTASPLVKQGRQAIQSLLKSFTWLNRQYHTRPMTLMSFVVFVLLLAAQQWLLPYPLATHYNNQGVKALSDGNLTKAQQSFEHAAALNPDRVVPYYNIGNSYERIGLSDKAKEFYQKGIEQDPTFEPGYRGLGGLFNQSGEYAKAEKVLLAGLNIHSKDSNELSEKVTYYELLANLGWSYWGQNKMEIAQATLEDALGLEADLKSLGEAHNTEYRLALPHFYLAQIYEEAGDVQKSIQQWEDALRFLDIENWQQRERYLLVLKHLQNLQNK